MAQRPVERREDRACASSSRSAASAATRCMARRGGVLPRPRHLHLLRHRQQQPDAARGDGPARAGRGVRPSARRPARCADARGGAARPRRRIVAAGGSERQPLPIGRLVDERIDRQRDGRAARHRRLDQPPDPLGRGAHARPASSIDWTDFAELSSGDAAAGARLSQRQRRREPVPGRGRTRLRAPRADRRPAACTPTSRPSRAGGLADYTRVPERAARPARSGELCLPASGDDDDRAPRRASRSATRAA